MIDLLARTAQLVDVASLSHQEGALADHMEGGLRKAEWLEVDRLGDNLVARTHLGRQRRILMAGHLDTVPPNGNETARMEDDVLWGLGAADMKGGVAVIDHLARSVERPVVDVTYVLYTCEEVDQAHNGLRQILAERPDLLAADAAVLGEPTGGRVEAGCQGTLRATVTMAGRRAHTARAWTGINAVHRLAPVIDAAAAYEGRRPVLDGCEYREALQVVRVEGGVAGNVVPDRAQLALNHRFAPDRDVPAALAHLREVLGPALGPHDALELDDAAAGARPHLDHPVLSELCRLTGEAPRAKLGWTDVAFFAAAGVAAANYGPGDPELAHSAEERVGRAELETAHRVLAAVIGGGATGGEGP